MTELFSSWPMLPLFVLASTVLALSPGPGVFYIVTRSFLHGAHTGMISVAGVGLGNLCNAFAASFGLAALFAASSSAFAIVKYAGALYLVYLGFKMFRFQPSENLSRPPHVTTSSHIFREGFFIALLNPKTTIFFAAFFPQFLNPEISPLLQSMILGLLFVTIAAITDSIYALAAGAIAPTLMHVTGIHRFARHLGAVAFISLGTFTALTGSPGSEK